MDYFMQPTFSVIIPTSGESPTLFRCLESCYRIADKISLEVVLVFDRTAPHLRVEKIKGDFPGIRVFVCPEKGVATSRNLGLKNMVGEYFLLIDDDCVIPGASWLNQLIDRIESSNEIHGGIYELPPQASYWARVYNWVNFAWLKGGDGGQGRQQHLLGGFMYGSKQVARQIFFNPQMKWGGEEKELLQRLYMNFKTKSFVHFDLKIRHQDDTGLWKFIKRAFQQGRAAGFYNLSTSRLMALPIPSLRIFPGLIFFFLLSRTGILSGKFLRAKKGSVRVAHNSPAP